MYSDKYSDSCLRNFPIDKPTFDPNDVPFIGSLPETLRVFQRVVGYELRFFRAGSSELRSSSEGTNADAYEESPQIFNLLPSAVSSERPSDQTQLDRVATFPVGNPSYRTYGFLELKRTPEICPQMDWDSACALTEALATNLLECYQWRSQTALCEGELAATCVRHIEPYSNNRATVSVRLRDILRVGARALGDFDAAALYLLDDATTSLSPRVLWGLPDERFLEPPRPLHGARAEVEALLGSVVVLNEDYTAEMWKAPEDFPCSVCVPVNSESTILGVAWFFSNRRRSINTRELETLNLIVGRLVDELEKEATFVQGPKLFEEKQENVEQATPSSQEFEQLVDAILSDVD